MNLRTLSYQEAATLLADKSDEELVDVLAGSSRKLGDTAWEALGRHGRYDLVIRALQEKKITTRDGKVRALNLLLSQGRRLPEAFPIYCQYASDRSVDTAGCALFGLAFWQDASVLPLLESLLGSKHSAEVTKTIDAIKAGDPKKHSPYFHYSQGVWKKEANQAAQTTPGSCAPLRV